MMAYGVMLSDQPDISRGITLEAMVNILAVIRNQYKQFPQMYEGYIGFLKRAIQDATRYQEAAMLGEPLPDHPVAAEPPPDEAGPPEPPKQAEAAAAPPHAAFFQSARGGRRLADILVNIGALVGTAEVKRIVNTDLYEYAYIKKLKGQIIELAKLGFGFSAGKLDVFVVDATREITQDPVPTADGQLRPIIAYDRRQLLLELFSTIKREVENKYPSGFFRKNQSNLDERNELFGRVAASLDKGSVAAQQAWGEVFPAARAEQAASGVGGLRHGG